MLDDTEALRARAIALEVGLRASRDLINKTVARARRRVQAQRRDRLWLEAELLSLEAREAELRRLLPELRRRDQAAATVDA
ncbi:MAG: hypothetical protein ACK44A_08125 [Roseateles sp.]